MTVAMTAVITPLVTASAVPERPRTLVAPPSASASRTRSVIWYSRSKKPSRPSPRVSSSTYPGTASMKSLTCETIVGMTVAARAAIARIAPTKTIVTASPRRRIPRCCSASTAGLSASARKIATKIQIRIPCAAWTMCSSRYPATMIPSTTRTVRGRKYTRRSSSIDARIGLAADGAQPALRVQGLPSAVLTSG